MIIISPNKLMDFMMGICTQSKIRCPKILPIDNPKSQKKKSKANKERVSGKILD